MIVRDWSQFLNNFPHEKLDIYFTPEYVSLYEDSVYEMKAFVFLEKQSVFILPFLLGRIESSEYFDFVSPYGYSGPIWHSETPDFLERAWKEFYREAQSLGIVAGFLRMHPFYPDQISSLPEFITPVLDRQTVVVDLEPELSDIWAKQIHSKHRNAIRKAENEGLITEFRTVTAKSDFDVFRGIYGQTMARLDADDFYKFSDSYFHNILKLPSENLVIGNVSLGGVVICSAIFFTFGKSAHYHLSGTADEFRSTGANGYLLYKAIEFLKGRGCTRFHLGGGTSPDAENSLFKFKVRFSPNRLQFYLGKCILNEAAYNDICRRWQGQHSVEHVLKYQRYHLKYRY